LHKFSNDGGLRVWSLFFTYDFFKGISEPRKTIVSAPGSLFVWFL